MGLRMTVFAALGMGVLAAPCGGLNPKNLTTGSNMLGKVSEGLEKAEECKKLDVDPSVTEEYALGGALAIHFVQRGGGLMLEKDSGKAASRPGEVLHDYVNIVGKNLAAQSQRPTLEWTFGVLNDSKSFNAVSAPGGYVFINRKVLETVDNEGQLAGVLAHEIAHVVLKHSVRQYNAAKVKTCKMVVMGESILSPGAADALSAGRKGDGTLDLDKEPGLLGKLAESTADQLAKGNSDEQEFEADRMAARLLVSAGYDPDDYRRLIAKTTEDTSLGVNHPKKSERVKNLVSYVATLKGKEGEFPELAIEGLRSPPLKPSAMAALRGAAPAVAKDTP
ncbi:M48 family metalloprotease [Pyxidicoccus fallax]|uniref:M48 family metalloprotease n=1 Tax=Pyxidicoccus fallax TaxID=394095 RepID=A0A848LZ88_9BACT|nr:M48 family metalloprotease [Pyxidicoccus fallax]NMO22920.1 M48 family metalloprotease [Pyxidicoccus fallax]NPC85887.1 M48 family metalloprotease [Pyxidicoccus fallax]